MSFHSTSGIYFGVILYTMFIETLQIHTHTETYRWRSSLLHYAVIVVFLNINLYMYTFCKFHIAIQTPKSLSVLLLNAVITIYTFIMHYILQISCGENKLFITSLPYEVIMFLVGWFGWLIVCLFVCLFRVLCWSLDLREVTN